MSSPVPQPAHRDRYHSLAIVDDTIDTDVFEVTAQTQDGIVKASSTAPRRWLGCSSPESVLTQDGYLMVGNFLAMAGMPEAVEAAAVAPAVSAQVRRRGLASQSSHPQIATRQPRARRDLARQCPSNIEVGPQ